MPLRLLDVFPSLEGFEAMKKLVPADTGTTKKCVDIQQADLGKAFKSWNDLGWSACAGDNAAKIRRIATGASEN